VSTVLVEGTPRELIHAFGNGRAIVDYFDAFVMMDELSDGTFELSGEPAREDEKPVLNKLVATIKNTTTVTDPAGNTKTFEDP